MVKNMYTRKKACQNAHAEVRLAEASYYNRGILPDLRSRIAQTTWRVRGTQQIVRLIIGITWVTIWMLGIISLLTKSP